MSRFNIILSGLLGGLAWAASSASTQVTTGPTGRPADAASVPGDRPEEPRLRRRDEIAMSRALLGAAKRRAQPPDAAVTSAILRIGDLGGVEAVDDLVQCLNYESAPKDQGFFRGPPMVEARYPAVRALIRLGPSAVDALLRALADGRLPEGLEVREAGYVIVTMLGSENGKKRVHEFADTLKEPERQRVLCDDIVGCFEIKTPPLVAVESKAHPETCPSR